MGRAKELARIDELVAGVATGRGGLAWIQGEPGAGKSALIDAALAGAEQAGCEVLRGAADVLMQPFPLRLMTECLGISARSPDPLNARISALLLGDHAEPGTVDPVLAAAERMLDLVDRRCVVRPLVLAVEDLHWGDEPSLLVWGRLARAVDQIPLLLIGSVRPLPQRTLVGQLRELAVALSGEVIDLGPLDRDSITVLAARIAKGNPGPRLRAALDRAGGNPLYLRELAAALVRDGQVTADGAEAELTARVTSLPASLTVAIGSRLGFIPDEVLKVLGIAALLGNEFDVAELATVTGRPVLDLADQLTDAVTGGVLTGAGERLRFRHELIREVLAGRTPAAVRSALHAEIARTLARSGSSFDAVARHLLATSDRPAKMGDWALDWLAGIGEQAIYALAGVFAELLDRAVGSTEADDPRWMVLAPRLALVLFWLGRDAEAERLSGEVIANTPDPVLAARMRILMLRSVGRVGRPADGLGVIAGAPSDDELPLLWQARLGAWSALVLDAAGRAAEGEAVARRSLELAAASADPLALAYAHHAAAMCGAPSDRGAHVEASIASLTSQDPESIDLRMLLLINRLAYCEVQGDAETAEAALNQALLLAEQAGTFRRALILTSAADFCHLHGRWDAALAHLAGIDDEFTGTEESGYHHGLAALIALHRGERDAADAHLKVAAASLPASVAATPVPIDPVTQVMALRAEADGELPRALALMSSWLTAKPGLRPQERHDDAMPYLVRLALAAGDRRTAVSAAEVSQADTVADDSPSRLLAARFCRAMVDDDAGELLAIAAAYREHDWPPREASAFEEAAARLAAAGDIAPARAAHTQAVLIRTLFGATWDIRRADARLRGYGVRRGPRSTHRRPPTGWDALTPSEERIARLVAQGLSNPDIAAELFLSRRTVQAHVSSILAKLQFKSRIEVMRAIADDASADR